MGKKRSILPPKADYRIPLSVSHKNKIIYICNLHFAPLLCSSVCNIFYNVCKLNTC